MITVKQLLTEAVNKSVIIDAINNGKVIEFDYNSPTAAKGKKIVEPHALGLSKSGEPALRAYPLSGTSAYGFGFFKIYLLKHMSNVVIKTFKDKKTKTDVDVMSNLKSRPKINYSGDKSFKTVHNISKKR
jgi:hypothetical protein